MANFFTLVAQHAADQEVCRVATGLSGARYVARTKQTEVTFRFPGNQVSLLTGGEFTCGAAFLAKEVSAAAPGKRQEQERKRQEQEQKQEETVGKLLAQVQRIRNLNNKIELLIRNNKELSEQAQQTPPKR